MTTRLLVALSLTRTNQILWFTLLSAAAFGQAPTMPNTVPYEDHGVYSINLQNLTIAVNIPIREKSGANVFSASYSGTLNTFASNAGFVQTNKMSVRADALSVNSLVGNQVGIWYTTRTDTGVPCTNHNVLNKITLTGWYVVTADGSVHPLPANIQMDENFCYHSSFSNQVATDGSGLTASYDMGGGTGSIVSANGNTTGTMAFFPGSGGGNGSLIVKDSNGNQISANSSYTAYTDTLGQPALTSTGGTTVPNYSWTDVNGGTQHIVFTTTSKVQSTAWGCPYPYSDKTYTAAPFLTKVAYPDSTNLLISYETSAGGITGRIQSITSRTGGVSSFTYSGINCQIDNSTHRGYIAPSQMTQAIDGKSWTYLWTPIFTTNGTYTFLSGNTTKVTDPAGNVTVYTFVGSFLVQAIVNQGASTQLSQQVVCYNGNQTNCTIAQVVAPTTEIDTYRTLGTMATSSRTKQTFDSYGNVLTSAVYGFGDTAPKFTTTTTYGGCGASVNNKPCDVLTSDGTNNVSESKATYDAPGNRLTSSTWTGTRWLGSSATYNGNGTIATTTAVDGTQTTLTYDGTCNGAFPTKSQVGSLITYASWDCSGGVKLTSTDANGGVTTYGYKNVSGTPDPFWRVSSVTDALQNIAYTSYSPNTVEHKFSFGSVVQDAFTIVDGYGRTIRTQTKHGSAYDTVSTSYGFNSTGATVTSSLPCSVALGADCTTGFTTVGAEPLGDSRHPRMAAGRLAL